MTKTRLWSIPFSLLFIAEYMMQIGLYGIRPIVSSYAVSLGATVAVAGLLSGLLSGVALLFRPICGLISDRYNSVNILLVVSIAMTISHFGCMLVPSIASIILFESVKGAAFTFKSAIVISAAALLIPKERIGLGIGIMSMTFTTAGAIGPIVSTALLDAFDYSGCYVVSGCISLLSIVALVILKAINPIKLQGNATGGVGEGHEHKTVLEKFIYVPALPYSFIAGFVGCAYGTLLALLFLVEEQGYVENAYLFFFVYTAIVVFARIIGGGLGDKRGVVVVIPMIALSVIGSVPLVFSGSVVCLLLGALALALGHGSGSAVLQAEAVRNAPKEETGKASNTFFIVSDLGMFVAPAVGGLILDSLGAPGLFAVNCLYLLIALFIALWVIVRPIFRARM